MKNILKIILLILIAYSVYFFAQNSNKEETSTTDIVVVENTLPDPIPEPVKEEEKPKIENQNPKIGEVVEWDGPDPYPSVDWSGAVPELKVAVGNFEKKWGKKLQIRQVYRPALYGKHMRSVWEVWRYINGKSYTHGYKCEEVEHINTKNIGALNQAQKDYLNEEARRHSFLGGDTPPGCVSDHAKGIAIDITPPIDQIEYENFIKIANSVGLCHYIKGDEPHFGLTAQLPEGTDCFVK
jgi:hypothetical protein